MSDKVYFNGINGATGQYLTEPMTHDEIAAIICDNAVPDDVKTPSLLSRLSTLWWKISQPMLGLPLDKDGNEVDATDLKVAGWGIVFLSDESDEVKKALSPLIEHRRRQIGDDTIVKVLSYHEKEAWYDWLADNGTSAGTIEPKNVPLYLLLIGDPARFSFEVGHQLSVEYAVGRLHFDTAEEYARYVQSVIRYENAAPKDLPTAKEVVFFAPRHESDRATQMSADLLIKPLVDGFTDSKGHLAHPRIAEQFGYRSRKLWGEAATKAALESIVKPVAGVKPPALLFSASHGLGFPAGHLDQAPKQGALLCQDWPGFGKINKDHYFCAEDLTSESRVHGMILFHFACYSAGTPATDRYIHKSGQKAPVIAPQPFISQLPKMWLAHPNGGALACIGHVERAWGYSIGTTKAGPQLQPFRNAIGRIISGKPIGYAMKDFYERYAALSVNLANHIQKREDGDMSINSVLTSVWTERNDAEGYIVIGDPAICLRGDDLS